MGSVLSILRPLLAGILAAAVQAALTAAGKIAGKEVDKLIVTESAKLAKYLADEIRKLIGGRTSFVMGSAAELHTEKDVEELDIIFTQTAKAATDGKGQYDPGVVADAALKGLGAYTKSPECMAMLKKMLNQAIQ